MGASLPVSESPGSAPFAFRRIFAPADRVNQWPTGATKYIPIDAAEFERLIKLVQTAASVSELKSAQLVTAEYEAQLDDDLLSGKFQWHVAHGAADPAQLTLDECNIAIDQPHWTGGDEAVLGNGPDGRLGLLVDRTGDVTGEWSLRGQPSVGGSVSFVMVLPTCACTRLTCDLPENLTAMADHGIMTQIPGARGDFAAGDWKSAAMAVYDFAPWPKEPPTSAVSSRCCVNR